MDIFLAHVTLIATGLYDEDSVNMDNTASYFLYLLAFYIIFIVSLNLLIAIISERFGIVLEQTIPMDCIERSSLMLEIEDFVQMYHFLRSYFGGKAPPDDEFYINLCRYHKRVNEDEADPENIETEGRVRFLQDKI